MMTIILLDNSDITIKQNLIGNTVINTSAAPKRSLDEWTPAYEKRCDHWKKIAKQIAAKRDKANN